MEGDDLVFKKLIEPAVSLMNRLPFKIKIIVSVSILFILLIMPSRTTFTTYMNKSKIYNDQLIGLSYTIQFQNLIQNIQLHRGLCNGYLNGNKTFIKEIISYEKKINTQLLELIEFDRQKLNKLRYDKDFVDALSSFMIVKFENNVPSMSINSLFQLHNKIVSDLVKTVQRIAKQTHFATSSNLRINYIAQLLHEKMLLLQENTGQLRGLAVGIFTKQEISSEQKSAILSKYTLIKALENNLLDNQILAGMENFIAIENNTALAMYKLDLMLDIVYKNIIESENLSFDSKEFFKKATDAIDVQTTLYKILSQSYETIVKEMKEDNLKELFWILTGFIIIILGAAYLIGAFYHSIVLSLKKLQVASEMIAAGETSIHLTADTNDELGNAILSFNTMSQKLDKTLSFLDGYKMAIDETSIVSKTNTKGIITYANKQFCEISGYEEKELIGMPHNIVRHPDTPKETFKEMWATIKSKKIWKGIVKNRKKDGGVYIVDATVIPVMDNDGDILEYVAVRHDVTELEKSKEEIKKQKIDILTGLSNQNQLLKDIKTISKPILLYLNINSFANINDFYGTKIADDVLIYFADLLRDMFINGECQIYKYHNDEFFLLFEEEVLNIQQCESLMQSIIDFIEHKTIECDGHSCISITISGGISHHLQSANPENLLSLAMIACKEAKHENKKYLLYRNDMNKESDYKNNIEWINKIKNAIAEDKLVPFFQPIIDNKTGAVTKFEALVRMIDENGKAISPFFFLDIAKKAKLYTQITKIMISKTFAQLDKLPHYEFSINLTVEDIKDNEIRDFIIEEVRTCQHADHIILEITESENITDYEQVNQFIQKVKKYGVKIAIDDFGSGYANFDHIISLNLDFIKIDGSLIKEIDTNEEASIITEAIIAFSKKLGSKTVVEYVHSKSVYEKVISLGADYSQGFHLGEPMEKITGLHELIRSDT
jgi:PAS domain S-box-containing protein/diguanylate cyclase (GGDEF)-like protein